ncbi:glycoside hydrolase family 16 protein [Phenylobacterium sp.]|uniref:glycoside hydrolase family 16 protein n=1 Tax=Phenylobacterium sp. TaxID=1871053 RepID=UPI0035B35AD2
MLRQSNLLRVTARQALVLCLAVAGALSAAPAALAAAKDEDPRAGRTLTFSDDFNSLSLFKDGRGVWTPRFRYAGPNELGSRTLPANGEKQVYVDPDLAGQAKAPLGLNPFRIEDGKLIIRAQKTPRGMARYLWRFRYTSGLLTSLDSFHQKYGYFEIRARLPKGAGLWPAFWLLPVSGAWPPEIDVFEVLGQDPTTVHQTVHWTQDQEHKSQHAAVQVADTSDGFHTFGVDWNSRTIRWYVDGHQTAEAPTPSDLDEPVYLLINLAVGGYWPGKVARGALPAEMAIDYVRVYSPKN